VIACDSYAGAPAMQVADEASLLDARRRARCARRSRSTGRTFIVPEVEAIRTEMLRSGGGGFTVVPSARATAMTMNRDAIRELAAGDAGAADLALSLRRELGEVTERRAHTGLPCVVKPVMSSSGKGQSTVRAERASRRLGLCGRQHARRPGAGDRRGVHRLRL
jgi:phosphoribosylglycinamide formyltransferase 2